MVQDGYLDRIPYIKTQHQTKHLSLLGRIVLTVPIISQFASDLQGYPR
jgi:hypothetical protein